MKRVYEAKIGPEVIMLGPGERMTAIQAMRDEVVTLATADGATSLGLFTVEESMADQSLRLTLDAEVPDA